MKHIQSILLDETIFELDKIFAKNNDFLTQFILDPTSINSKFRLNQNYINLKELVKYLEIIKQKYSKKMHDQNVKYIFIIKHRF